MNVIPELLFHHLLKYILTVSSNFNILNEENEARFIGIVEVDVIILKSTDHGQAISKFDMMDNNAYLDTRSRSRVYVEIDFANQGREHWRATRSGIRQQFVSQK